MDCFFHAHVPSVAPCVDCGRGICATCRDSNGACPSCRLAARIDSAAAGRGELPGQVGPSAGHGYRATPPPGGYGPGYGPNPEPAAAPPPSTALATVSPETRALVGLGYPFWPLAALALLDPKRSAFVRRQALQSLAFSFGFFGFSIGLTAIAHIPILGLSAWPLIPLLVPIYLIATVVYGFKAWQGDDVRVPLVSDWLDQRHQHDAGSPA
ncbi:MAG: DUF4870 domain-containing protein [Candidatus Baltobacteraceae bacterium]